ncbi:MAG: ABC transporter substrate-binding protein [Massiliimalia sp.]|jgi:multiple sugar transport system substrate-binding protein
MKRFLTLVCTVMILISTVSCGEEAKGKPQKFRIDVHAVASTKDDPLIAWLEDCANEWSGEKYQIEITSIFTDNANWMIEHKKTLDVPEVSADLVLLTPGELSYYADTETILPMDQYMEQNEAWDPDIYIDSLLENSSVDGKLYGIPVLSETQGLWYRKDILTQIGLPEEPEINTWEEFLSILKTIKQNCPEVLPFFHFGDLSQMTVFNAGGKFIDEKQNKWVSQSTPYRETFEFVEQLAVNDLVTVNGISPGKETRQEYTQMFREGKIAFCLDGNFFREMNENNIYTPWENFSEDVGFLPFPSMDGSKPYVQNTMRHFVIPKYSRYPEEVFDFIQYCMSSKSYGEMAVQTPYLPTTKSAAELSYYTDDPIRSVQVDLLSNTKNLMRIERFNPPFGGFSQLLLSVESGEVTAQKAFDSYPVIATNRFSESDLIVLP